MAIENFTTYTEVDPNTRITVTATRVTGAPTLTRGESAYVYSDKGVGHFVGDFEHLVAIRCSAAVGEAAATVVWALGNSIGDFYERMAAGNGLCIWFNLYYATDPSPAIILEESYGLSSYRDDYKYAGYNIWYYLRIRRTGSILTCEIYSDAARTVLIDTLSLVLHTVDSYRYVYAISSVTDAWMGSSTLSADIENLDLQEVAPTPPSPAPATHEQAEVEAGTLTPISTPTEVDPAKRVLNGHKTVTTAGTAVPIGTGAIISITLKALHANTGMIYVGGYDVAAANGFVLDAGEPVSLDVDNLADVYINADINGEGVSWIAVAKT